MTFKYHFILIALVIVMCCAVAIPSAQAGNNTGGLDARQEAIVPIAAFAASGELDPLKQALNDGLEAGLTVNEIKEVLVQLYAYAGFPRSLNAIGTFMTVVEERKQKGLKDQIGTTATPIPANQNTLKQGTKIQTQVVGRPVTGKLFTFSPAIDLFLKMHLFGAIFGRDNLDFKSREIATLAALANMEGVIPQLKAHFGISMNVGLSKTQLKNLIAVIEAKVGTYQADRAAMVLTEVIGNGQIEPKVRKISVTHTAKQPPREGPADWFTGSVKIAKPFKADAPSHFSGRKSSSKPVRARPGIPTISDNC